MKHQINRILPKDNTIELAGGEQLSYDVLIIATGAKIAPEETEGMKGAEWQKSVFDFYTFEGSLALRNKLRDWEGGKLVVHIIEMPIKCPVAPLEFAFLADSFFKHIHMRNRVEITYVSPLSGAFTKPKCTDALEYLLAEKVLPCYLRVPKGCATKKGVSEQMHQAYDKLFDCARPGQFRKRTQANLF